MPRKTKIIFITVFILVGIIILGFYFYNKSKKTPATPSNPSLFDKFNPFGTSTSVNNNPVVDKEEGDIVMNEEGDPVFVAQRLHKLTDFAVSGATFFEESKIVEGGITKVTPSLRYVEKATGHIYQMNLELKTSGKVSNSTIPSVYETIFSGDANSVMYRYASSDNKSITSFLATIGGGSSFLSSDILEVSLSPSKDKFFTIVKNLNGVVGVIKSFKDIKTSQVFTSPLSEWLAQWVTDQSIYLTTKPSYLVEGSTFSLNIANGTLTKVFGGVNGLTTLANKDGSSLLYGASLNSGPELNIFNIKSHSSLDLNKYGLPEKCLWNKDNINIYCAIPSKIAGVQYPDMWYQGLVSFDDFFVEINTQTGEASTLTNTQEDKQIDAINLFFNKDETNLFFINKKDYTLWSLDL